MYLFDMTDCVSGVYNKRWTFVTAALCHPVGYVNRESVVSMILMVQQAKIKYGSFKT